MRSFKRIILGSLLIAWMGSSAQAQVVLNMPPPKPKAVARATVQTSDQPAESIQVGEVALTRYAQRRSLPRADYGYGRPYGRPYGYNYYPYGYGYYPFYGGFGYFTFGHHIHHHHDNSMGGGGGD